MNPSSLRKKCANKSIGHADRARSEVRITERNAVQDAQWNGFHEKEETIC